MTLDELRYPTGKWVRVADLDGAGRAARIDQIDQVPEALAAAVAGLSEAQLDTPYREGGWTPRQIVHHLADSHMNAFTRFKLGVTEDNPTIKPYNEKDWAEMPDARVAPPTWSLSIIEGLHARWVQCLQSMDAAAFARTVMHPERGPMTLGDMMQLYAWHGAHHVTQITALRARMGW
jgi:uncharacterized damage-inducible protein DinB